MSGHDNDLHSLLIAVDMFAQAMKAKLRRKATEGYSGGLESASRAEVAARFHEHLAKGGLFAENQEVDVANLVMMLWWQRKAALLKEISDELAWSDK